MGAREGEERFLNMEGEGDMVIAMGDGELGMLDVVKGVVEGSSSLS
jgi:hypothetical protein